MKNNKPKTGINSPIMLVPLMPTDKQVRNFKKKIRFTGPDGCWEWTAAKDKGYGTFSCTTADGKNRIVKAHRLAYVVFENTQPLDQVVRHRCGNTSCVNPAHSKLGTQMDNHLDSVRDGTSAINQVGEAHPASKLNWNSVNEIRRAYSAKELNQYQLAEKFGVVQANIYNIVNNKTWKDEDYQP